MADALAGAVDIGMVSRPIFDEEIEKGAFWVAAAKDAVLCTVNVVIVTRILRQARRLADYVVFLYMGEIVEHGPTREFFEHPREPRTRAYISGEFS